MRPYTEKELYNAALQCTSVKEFGEKFPKERAVAGKRKNNDGVKLLDTYTWLEKRKIHTYESVRAAAMQCEELSEFIEKFHDEYVAAFSHKDKNGNNWLSTFTHLVRKTTNKPLEKRVKRTYEDCYKAAKQCSYVKEFKSKFPREWGTSCRHKNEDGVRWIDTFTHLIKKNSYTPEKCYEAAKQCDTLKEFVEKFPGEYAYASANTDASTGKRLIHSFTWLKKNNRYTYEGCYAAAKQCKTQKEFHERFPNEWNVSYKHETEDGIKWIDTFGLEKQVHVNTITVINSFIENIDFWEALTIPEILGLASAFGDASLMGRMLKKLAKSDSDSEERKFMLDSIKEMANMSEDEAFEELNKDESDDVKENDMIEEMVKSAENMPSDEKEYQNELERIGKVAVGLERLQSNKDIMNIINSGDVIKTLKDSITKRILLLSFEHPQVFDELTEMYGK